MKPNPHIADASEILETYRKSVMPGGSWKKAITQEEALQALASGLISKMPEKKDTSYMDTPYGVNNGKDAMVAQNNGYNQALDEVKQQILDYFGVSK